VPQMFGSIRVLMASTSQLDDFPENGIQWGDLGEGKKFRHAGLSAEEVGMIVPNELYAGIGGGDGNRGDDDDDDDDDDGGRSEQRRNQEE
jgi:hypothetical protein